MAGRHEVVMAATPDRPVILHPCTSHKLNIQHHGFIMGQKKFILLSTIHDRHDSAFTCGNPAKWVTNGMSRQAIQPASNDYKSKLRISLLQVHQPT